MTKISRKRQSTVGRLLRSPSWWVTCSLAAALYTYVPNYVGCNDREPASTPTVSEMQIQKEGPKKHITSEEVEGVLRKYGDTIEQYLKQEKSGIDKYVVGAIVHHESGGNPSASNGSCYGLMQKCGAEYKRLRGRPQAALKAGIDHLATVEDKFEKYTDRTRFTLAAYNIGDAVIKDAITATGEQDPNWSEVSDRITPRLLQKYFPNWSKRQCKRRIGILEDYVSGVMNKAYVADKRRTYHIKS